MKGCPHASPLRVSLPPEGALFALGRPGGKRVPPRFTAYAVRCPPRGRFLPWGGPAAKGCPHASPLRVSLPPEGALFALGRPGGKRVPPRFTAYAKKTALSDESRKRRVYCVLPAQLSWSWPGAAMYRPQCPGSRTWTKYPGHAAIRPDRGGHWGPVRKCRHTCPPPGKP
ncbi:hypothetical protein ECAE60S_01357 [Eoetvoesiella caeni]